MSATQGADLPGQSGEFGPADRVLCEQRELGEAARLDFCSLVALQVWLVTP